MGNGSKINTKGICRQFSISFCSSYPVSSDTHGYKWSWGGGRSFRFEQGRCKKNVDEDNGFSGPLNSIWTLTFRKMRTKTIFHDQLLEDLSNKWWSEVNLWVSSISTAVYRSWCPHAEHSGGENTHLTIFARAPAWHQPFGSAERSGDGTLGRSCIE